MTPREFDALTASNSSSAPTPQGPADSDRALLTPLAFRRRQRRRRIRLAVLAIAGLLVIGGVLGVVRSGSSPWQQIFSDDFDSSVARGEFAGSPYASSWSAYDDFADTSGHGRYSAAALSVTGGSLDMYVRTQDGQPQSAAVVPLVNGQWGGQLYGRYEVRFRSDEIPGYKLAFLLWPDTNNWAEGEIDFPEIGSLESGNTLYANVFPKGDLATGYPGASVGFTTETEAANSGWHTAVIEWSPGSIFFALDGTALGTITQGVPDTLMHLVLQVETAIGAPAPASDVAGHVQVDSVRVDRYLG
jgi:hypothetical protein